MSFQSMVFTGGGGNAIVRMRDEEGDQLIDCGFVEKRWLYVCERRVTVRFVLLTR